MSAALQAIVFRTCAACHEEKSSCEFSSTTAYCKPCRAAYSAARYAAIKAGTWKPKERGQHRPRQPGLPPPRIVHVAPPVNAPDVSAALYAAMGTYFAVFGFSALLRALTQMQGDLARANREALAREGWIA